MFEISGVFDNKFYPNGQISRMKKAFKMHLNTEDGVVRFIEEQKPFSELSIKSLIDNQDKTEYFLGKSNVT